MSKNSIKLSAQTSEGAIDFTEYKASRIFVIIEAMVEYLASLTIAGAFIAKVSTSLGISDGLTGIISAIASLGSCFQIIGLLLSNKKRVKPMVCATLYTANILFCLIYVTPLVKLPSILKPILFSSFMVGGYALRNIVGSPRTKWTQGFVEQSKRGRFNSTKECVSLVFGMTYSLILGNVIDYFEAKGDLRTAFLICAIAIFTFGTADLFMFLSMKETPYDEKNATGTSIKDIFASLKDKTIWKITAVRTLYCIAFYSCHPFFGTYQNIELGFSMAYVSIVSMVGLLAQATTSIPFGRLCDRRGSRFMLTVCYSTVGVSCILYALSTPANGTVMFLIANTVYHLGAAGNNFAFVNLIYEYSSPKSLASTLSVAYAIAGLVGFFATTLMSIAVEYIQTNGFSFFGISLYAQQVISFFSALVCVALVIFLRTSFKKPKKLVTK